MECTGTLIDTSIDLQTRQPKLTFLVNEALVINEVDKLRSCEKLSIKAVRHRKKRSLDANAYYWQLLTKVAESMELSKPQAHNYFLRHYGQLAIFDGKAAYIVLPDTKETEKTIEQSETYHLKPTSQVKEGKDGLMYRTYMMLRGSSEYNTKEMSVLIDGLVSEAKELGIEVLSPDELERLKEEWRAYEQAHKSMSV